MDISYTLFVEYLNKDTFELKTESLELLSRLLNSEVKGNNNLKEFSITHRDWDATFVYTIGKRTGKLFLESLKNTMNEKEYEDWVTNSYQTSDNELYLYEKENSINHIIINKNYEPVLPTANLRALNMLGTVKNNVRYNTIKNVR